MISSEYKRYHELYDNDRYLALRTKIEADNDEMTTTRIMNGVTDCAIAYSGYGEQQTPFEKLAFYVWQLPNRQMEMIIEIEGYLAPFRSEREEYLMLLSAKELFDRGEYMNANDLATRIHSARGRYLAYISQAMSILRVASVIPNGTTDYQKEKIDRAIERLNYARAELG